MLWPSRRHEQEDLPERLEHPHHLEPCKPEILDGLKGLARDDQVSIAGWKWQSVGKGHHHVGVRPRRDVYSRVAPGLTREQRFVAAVHIVAADVQNAQRLVVG
jgi:hypothetical protein